MEDPVPSEFRFRSCGECAAPMSRKAFSCPRCGAPNGAKLLRMTVIAAILLTLLPHLERCAG